MEDEYFDEDEDFADMMAAASYQDSVTNVSGREQRDLHRDVWEFCQIMNDGEAGGVSSSGRPRRPRKNANNQKPAEMSCGEKKALTAWRLFFVDLAVFVLSCFLGWQILMFVCASAVSLIFTWSILPARAGLRRFKFHDFVLLFLGNAIWFALMIWIFYGNALEPATYSFY